MNKYWYIGVGVERARQIENKAMKALRLPRHSEGFWEYFELYLTAASVHHVGVESFQRTWTSEVERDALGRR